MENLQMIASFNLTQIVKNNTVEFDSYRAGFFYYTVDVAEDRYRFPIEMNEVGTATMFKSDKALLYMRFIKKAIDGHQFIKVK